MSTQRGSCTLLLVVLLAGCYARNAAVGVYDLTLLLIIC